MNVSCVTLGIVFLLFLGQLLAQATMSSNFFDPDKLNMARENPTDMTGWSNQKPKSTSTTWNNRAAKKRNIKIHYKNE